METSELEKRHICIPVLPNYEGADCFEHLNSSEGLYEKKKLNVGKIIKKAAFTFALSVLIVFIIYFAFMLKIKDTMTNILLGYLVSQLLWLLFTIIIEIWREE